MFKTLKRNFLPFIIAFSALSVSASAAFYSVSGLSKLFAGASFEVMVMAGSLEVAKLVVASLLYQYWDTINKGLRAYLATATIILVLITSMGIYGFLSAAYQDTYRKLTVKENQTAFLEQKKQFYENDVTRYDKELERISANISTLSNARSQSIQVRDTSVAGGVRTTISTSEIRMAAKRIEVEEENRKGVQKKREIVADSLQKYQLQILELENNSEVAGELGPLQYLSGLTGAPMDRIINWLLLVIIFVFDPLAISLVVAANFAFDQANREKEEDTEYTPRDSVFDGLDDDEGWHDEDWHDEDDIPAPEPNDNLRRAAERYAEDVIDEGMLRPENPNVSSMDVSMDKENAMAWGKLADELAKGIVEEEDEDDAWINDPDVQAFLENEDKPGPWPEEYDKSHLVAGMTNDKEGSFMEFQKKQDSIGIQDPYDVAVDRHAPEEWDEDHALDQVLNDMVDDLDDLEEDILVAETEAELGLAEAELGLAEAELALAEEADLKEPEQPVRDLKPSTFIPNEPTSVGVTVNDIIEPVPSIVEKVPTPHLPDEARGVEPPSEDELFDQAMRERAEKDKQEFLKKRDDKQN